MNILAVCNTPLQIICALRLRQTVYANDKFDIIISDHMVNSKVIVDNANDNKIFNRAQYAESYMLCRNKEHFFDNGTRGKLQRAFCRKKLLENIVDIDKKYDVMLFNNFDKFGRIVYQVLRRDNYALKAYMIEDGYSSYFAQGLEWTAAYRRSIGIKNKIKRLVFGEAEPAAGLSGQYVYSPELVQWQAPFERLPIPKLRQDDKMLVNQLNQLFGYTSAEDCYDAPIIFFEESFRKEGYDIGDVELVETAASIVGKDNITVKRHPRNDDNLFEKLGYKVNSNTIIPWELIIMNNPDFKNKTFMTICSGAAATPYTMFDIPIRSVILLHLMKNREKIEYDFFELYFNYMENEVFKRYPNVFFIPDTEDELTAYISNSIDEGSSRL